MGFVLHFEDFNEIAEEVRDCILQVAKRKGHSLADYIFVKLEKTEFTKIKIIRKTCPIRLNSGK